MLPLNALLLLACVGPLSLSWAFDLTILHTNDLHSRFDEITSRGSSCKAKDRAADKCYGGVARIKRAADDAKRQANGAAIFVNAGDFFQGTVWYSMFKWGIVANLTAPLGYTATSLGNHEFDDGVGDLVKFLNATQNAFPTLACNLDLSAEPELKRWLKGHLVHPVPSPSGSRDVLVGIAGYVTPETKDLASTGDVVFLPEVDSLRNEVAELKLMGVDIVVVVGHSGYEVDLEIAKQVPGVDVVVGGHTNTFLWSDEGEPSKKLERDSAVGEYPTVVRQEVDGRQRTVLVVQTSGYGKYLGRLTVRFDDRTGEVADFWGNPVLLDAAVAKDAAVEREVRRYAAEVAAEMEKVVGTSAELIDGSRPRCRLEECPFGDLVTDAMAQEMGVDIAIINSGAIKGSFQKGEITMEDVIIAMPWANTVDVVTIPGKALKAILEHSVSNYDANHKDPGGRFLQFSGLIATFDVRKEPGERLVKARLGRPEDKDQLREIDDDGHYDVAVLSFMVSGGDGYKMIPAHLLEHRNTGFLDGDLIVQYLNRTRPVRAPVPGRIIMLDRATAAANSNADTTWLLLPLLSVAWQALETVSLMVA